MSGASRPTKGRRNRDRSIALHWFGHSIDPDFNWHRVGVEEVSGMAWLPDLHFGCVGGDINAAAVHATLGDTEVSSRLRAFFSKPDCSRPVRSTSGAVSRPLGRQRCAGTKSRHRERRDIHFCAAIVLLQRHRCQLLCVA
jgi:hypothetical protein